MNPDLILPEDITAVDADELTKLDDAITKAAEAIDGDELTEADADELVRLADMRDVIVTEQSRRADQAAENKARADEARGRLNPPEVEEADPVETPEVVDQDDAADDADDDDTGDETPVATLPATAPQPVAATAKNTAALAAKRPAAAAPRPTTPARSLLVATQHAAGTTRREGSEFATPADLAKAIVDIRKGWSHIPNGVHDFVAIGTGVKERSEFEVGYDALQNFSTFREMQVGAPALVASGGGCAPYAPSYEFFRLSQPQNPIENSLPTAQAPRGGIRFMLPMDVADAADAIDRSAQDRDFSGATVVNTSGPKSCVSVSCPGEDDAKTEAVSQCVTWDNLNYRAFPEQVEAFMEDVAVQFVASKELFYLDFVRANSTLGVTSSFAYGASRALLHDWTTAATNYRKRHRMPRHAEVQLLVSDIALDIWKLDMAMDPDNGLSFFDIDDQMITDILLKRGIRPVWYNDASTADPTQRFAAAQATGALNVLPQLVIAYMYAPGTFVRLDGGTLDVGLVRDSTLNGTNDLQLFMEEWIGMAKIGLESVEIESTVLINGAAGQGVTTIAAA